MFIITALVSSTRSEATLEWKGMSTLSDIIDDALKTSTSVSHISGEWFSM